MLIATMTRPSDFPEFSTKTWDALREFDYRLEAHTGYQEHVRLRGSVTRGGRQGAQEVLAEVTQRLHNYVAGTMTLVDHSRRLLRGRSGAEVDEFSGKLATVLENSEIAFVRDLRNFMLHRSLPLIAHRLRLSGGEGEATQGRSDLLLQTADLLAWTTGRDLAATGWTIRPRTCR